MPISKEKRKRKVLVQCHLCKEYRLVCYAHKKRAEKDLCFSCGIKKRKIHTGTGEKCWNWRGGKIEHSGYILEYVPENDFFYPMGRTSKGLRGSYVPEHRLIMARKLGRLLHRWEQIHHVNGDTRDNRIQNLLLRDATSHPKKYGDAYSQGYGAGYKKGYKDGSSNS